MKSISSIRRSRVVILAATALVGAMLTVPAGIPASAAEARSLPVPPSAVPVPTVQIDGVAWQQLVVGDTVYVGGSFQTARPAGSPAGQNTVVRQNLLAFNINTGALLPGFVANTNAQVLGLTMSPDGSRLYVSGEFTSVNGSTRYRIAALNPITGAVITQFNAGADYRIRSVVTDGDIVYVGGSFGAAGGAPRANLAAFRASDGAVLNWAPSANNGQVMAISMIPGSGKMVVGGAFTDLNGTTAEGLGAVDPVTGATLPYAVNQVVQNRGPDGAVYALTRDDQRVYGAGYTFGRSGGNFEGNFGADPQGNLDWLNDVHGDQYDVYSTRGMLFSVGHLHSDYNVPGGKPQTNPSVNWYAMTQESAANGLIQENTQDQARYADFAGNPASTVLHWYPEFTPGTYTDSNMAGWCVDGDDKYVVIAGEFTRVNNVQQQGIVRFAFRDAGAANDAPRLGAANFVPDVTSPAAGTAQISFVSNWDRDDEELTYWVQREGAGTIGTYSSKSVFYRQPTITHLDEGLTPGSTQRYRIVATDPQGARAWGDYVNVTIAADGTVSDYASTVLGDRPSLYWRMSDSGSALVDSAYTWDGSVSSGVVRGVEGAITGEDDTATRFSGGTQTGWHATRATTPTTFSTEAWVKTTTTTGGMISGFGSRATGSSTTSSSTYRTYMADDGRVIFGVLEGVRQVVSSPSGFNDGQWHHVVSTLDWDTGARLYVDGVLVAQDVDLKHGTPTSGYWRVAGDTLAGGWPSRPTTDYLAGDIDEFAVYSAALPADRVAAHYAVGRAAPVPNVAPEASFSFDVSGLGVSVDGSGSSDSDGSVASYAWDFGDGESGSGETASHTYAAAGTYSVELTVTDDQGATGTTSQDVTVSVAPANVAPEASFSFDVSGLGVSVDGSGSSDSDGSVASYAWDFGDGESGSGETASHTYAAAGTYSVELTVTDDQGATGTTSQDVTVSVVEPGVLAVDNFSRTVSAGWGSAQTGGAWAFTGSSSYYSVDGAVGQVVLSSPGVQREVSLPIDAADVDLRAKVGLDKAATGGGLYLSIGARSQGNSAYVARLRYYSDASVALHLQRKVNGAVTTLVGGTVAGLTAQAGELLNVRLEVSGTDSATVRAKVWAVGDSEPGSWTQSVTDSTTDLRSPGGIYLQPYLSGSANNTPVRFLTDDVNAVTVGGGLPVPNVAPEASFSFDVSGLGVSVDGSGSSDSDGSVASYAWDFGDGESGSGETASHTYAAAGTYSVELTVTDDQGATGTTSQDVTVSVAPANVAPEASFSFDVSGLGVSVDGSGSSDSDGSVASYAWDFGDGESGSGETASHTYAAAGTYSVELTVTDDQGATGTTSQDVTVSVVEPGVLAVDNFSRTVSAGWGSAQTGGAWAFTGSSSYYSVDGAVGQVVLSSPGVQREVSLPIDAADVDLRAKVGLDKAATGGGLYLSIGARSQGNSAYVARLRYYSDASVALHLQRKVNGAVTTLVGGTVAGLTAQAGELLNVRLEVSGTDSATVRAKVWAVGDSEPGSWTQSVTDSTTDLRSPGGIYLQPYLSGSANNTPVRFLTDDVEAVIAN